MKVIPAPVIAEAQGTRKTLASPEEKGFTSNSKFQTKNYEISGSYSHFGRADDIRGIYF